MGAVLSARLGRPGTTVLLLIHGAGGSSRHWQWVSGALPAWLAPIAFDLPGHGRSDGTVPDSVEEATAAIWAALGHIGVGDQPFALVAHSFGGLVALTMAVQQPPSVSHLGLLCTAARITPNPAWLAAAAGAAGGEDFIRAGVGPAAGPERVRVVLEDLATTRLGPDPSLFLGGARTDLSGRLGEVTARTLVAIAAGDPVISPRKSRALAAGIDGAEVIVLQGGHYPHIEQPIAVAEHLARLISNRPERRPVRLAPLGGLS